MKRATLTGCFGTPVSVAVVALLLLLARCG